MEGVQRGAAAKEGGGALVNHQRRIQRGGGGVTGGRGGEGGVGWFLLLDFGWDLTVSSVAHGGNIYDEHSAPSQPMDDT